MMVLLNEVHSHVMITCCETGLITCMDSGEFQEQSLQNYPLEISILFWSLVLVKTLTRFESSLGDV